MEPKSRILVVDDHPQNLKLVRLLLESEGYDVRTAVDSKEVFGTLPYFRPDLILMDIQLPGMDGLEITRRLKANPAYQGIVVFAVTAYAMKGDEEKALRAGCEAYITKPIDTRALLKKIRECLQVDLAPVAERRRG